MALALTRPVETMARARKDTRQMLQLIKLALLLAITYQRVPLFHLVQYLHARAKPCLAITTSGLTLIVRTSSRNVRPGAPISLQTARRFEFTTSPRFRAVKVRVRAHRRLSHGDDDFIKIHASLTVHSDGTNLQLS